MSWKNWPSWLKGGIIGLIIAAIAGLGMFLMVFIGSSLDDNIFSETILIRLVMYLTFLISLTIGLPIMITSFMICFKSCSSQQTIMIYFIWMIIYFLIGSILGLLYGKFKKIKGGKLK